MTAAGSMPYISVVVPVLNEEDQITDLVNSLDQDRSIDQLVIVDGGSHDATWHLAQSGRDRVRALQVVLAVSKSGRSRQMNRGAALADGDVLIFLHADTRLPRDAGTELAAADRGPWFWGRFDVSFDTNRLSMKSVAWLMNHRSALTGIATGDQALFVSREAFQSVGGFPDILLMEDIALSKKLKRLGPPHRVRRPVITSSRRWRESGVIATILRMWWFRMQYWAGVSPGRLAHRYPHIR